MDICPACGTIPTPTLPPLQGLEGQGQDCPRCGQFYLIGTAVTTLPHSIATGGINRSVMSHLLRRRFDNQRTPVLLFEDSLKLYFINRRAPSPQEQANNLILWIGTNQRTHSEWVRSSVPRLAAIVGSAVGGGRGGDEPDFGWLQNQMRLGPGPQLYDVQSGTPVGFKLTFEGWKQFDELSRRVVASRTAFMAMKFNDVLMDRVLRDCFKPAAERAGFTLRPVNENQAAGLIDDQIRAAIRTARFIVADLSHDSNGAYFEAGFAEGLGLPVIYTCEAQKFADKKTHFDTNHMHTIPWNEGKLADAGRELTATIRNTLPLEAKMTD